MHKEINFKKKNLSSLMKIVKKGFTIRMEVDVSFPNRKKIEQRLWQIELNNGNIYFKILKTNKSFLLLNNEDNGNEFNIDRLLSTTRSQLKFSKKEIDKAFNLDFEKEVILEYKEMSKRDKKRDKHIAKTLGEKKEYRLVKFKTRSRIEKTGNKNGENEIRLYLNRLFKSKIGYIQKDEYTTAGLKTRADSVLFSKDEIIVYEIKSDKDSFARLNDQIKDYCKYGNKIYLVLHQAKLSAFQKNHSELLSKIGLMVYYPLKKAIILEKKAPINTPKLNSLDLLWREEHREILRGMKGISKVTTMSQTKKRILEIFGEKFANDLAKILLYQRYKANVEETQNFIHPGKFTSDLDKRKSLISLFNEK